MDTAVLRVLSLLGRAGHNIGAPVVQSMAYFVGVDQRGYQVGWPRGSEEGGLRHGVSLLPPCIGHQLVAHSTPTTARRPCLEQQGQSCTGISKE